VRQFMVMRLWITSRGAGIKFSNASDGRVIYLLFASRSSRGNRILEEDHRATVDAQMVYRCRRHRVQSPNHRALDFRLRAQRRPHCLKQTNATPASENDRG